MTSSVITKPEHSPSPTPIRGVYGFVGYIIGVIGLLTYFTWAIVPDATLEALGLTFFPQKYWAVALPIYCGVVFFVFVTLIYPGLGLCCTPFSDDKRNETDEFAVYHPKTASNQDDSKHIPLLGDMPLSEVKKLLTKKEQ